MSTILPLKQQIALGTLLGKSPQFLKEVRKVPVVAETDVSILITGETGTGKELFARAIHYLSKRSPGPFVPVNCGAIPVELMESELFGHEQGSFTGAVSRKPGLVQEAQGGTLFLDEIDTLTLHAQVKLLRFLQEKECRPVGSTKTEKADVRVISATNIQVDAALRSGRLRTDLYYRLNIMCLAIPPLRQRQEDIRILAGHFLKKYSLEFGKCVEGFSQAAIQALTCYDWPGNVRELERLMERAVALATGNVIELEDLPPGIGGDYGEILLPSFKRTESLKMWACRYARLMLERCQGNKRETARALGISYHTLISYLRGGEEDGATTKGKVLAAPDGALPQDTVETVS